MTPDEPFWLQAFFQDLGLATVAGACAILGLFFALAWCRIFARAGFHPALGVLMLLPGANLVLFLALAFVRWPRERELASLRALERPRPRANSTSISEAA